MLANEATTLVRAKTLALFKERHPGLKFGIKVLPQPMQAGPSSEPTAYLYVIGNRPVGSPRISINPVTKKRRQTDSLEMTIQVSMRSLASTDPNVLTSMDYATSLRSIMQGADFIKAIQPQATILRVTDIRTTTFKDDSDQYSNVPSFDIILKHQNVYEGGLRIATRFETSIWAVPDII